MKIRTTSAAELEVANAALSYDLLRLGLGAAFIDEVEKTYAAIEKGPQPILDCKWRESMFQKTCGSPRQSGFHFL